MPRVLVQLAVSTLPRPIPQQPFYLTMGFAMLVGGLLPFGTVFVELFFILSSLWLDQYYYVFGFLLLVCAVVLSLSLPLTLTLTA